MPASAEAYALDGSCGEPRRGYFNDLCVAGCGHALWLNRVGLGTSLDAAQRGVAIGCVNRPGCHVGHGRLSDAFGVR